MTMFFHLADRYWEDPDRLLRVAKLPLYISASSSSKDQRTVPDKVNKTSVLRCQM